MNVLQLFNKDSEEFGLFTCLTYKDQTETINLCRSRAETAYDNDLEAVLELDELFMEELEKEGITRVFAEEYYF